MARLKVKLNGKTIAELPLAEDRTYLAGRKDTCDIILNGEKGISREHFKLTCNGGQWSLESLSRFGEVFLAGEKVTTMTLDHGMAFAVPPYEFEFLMTTADAGAAAPQPAAAAPAEGDVEASTNALPVPVAPAASDYVAEKTFVGVAPSVPYIKVMDKQGEARELIRLEGGDSYIAGRDSTCNIYIRDSRVSRRQFEIRRNGLQYSIIDLGSVNGTLVNGNPISTTDPTPLRSGDAISVLENYLYFELHDPNFKSRLELVSLQPMPEVPSNPLQALVPMTPPPNYPMPMGGVPNMPPVPYHPGANLPAEWAPQMAPAPAVPQAQMPPAKGLQLWLEKIDYKKNKVRILLGAVALVGFIFAFSSDDEPAKNPSLGPMVNDPFAKLSPEQKKLVKDTLQLSKSYYMQGKYEFARSELVKMQEIVPNYEDSDGLMKLITDAITVQQLQRKQEELERAKAEQEAKIQAKAAECRKQINPHITRDLVEQCLLEVIPFNPSHPLFAELYAEADRLVAERKSREAQEEQHREQIAKLKGMYSYARGLEGKEPLQAIAAYQRVVASVLPDPSGVKGQSQTRIADLRKQVNQKTQTFQDEADKFAKEGRLKEAILSLRRAVQIDPKNPDLEPKIEAHRQRLKEQMMVIYQEGVLEESFGNVEADPNKGNEGAKAKWRLILQKDIPDGEYFRKAQIKLKKYGVN